MSFDHEIELITIEYEEDDLGDNAEIKVIKKVPASKIDYRNKDFYQAMANGLKPSLTFGINKHEYEGQKTLTFEEEEYKIIDVFPVKQKYTNEFETIALMCEGMVNK